MDANFNHFDGAGNAIMVDVSPKQPTLRAASARGKIRVSRPVLDAILGHTAAKGDVLGVARVAGIMATKRTSDLIPLCHPLMLSKVEVNLQAEPEHNRVRIETLCRLTGKTGVEMEALTAASVAALTIYDMCKAIDRGMHITNLRVIEKDGGKSGHFTQQ